MRKLILIAVFVTLACGVLLDCGDDEHATVFLPPRRAFDDGRELFFAKDNRYVVGLSWAPNGRRFVYVDYEPGGGGHRVNIYEVTTGQDRVLVPDAGGRVRWSPSGEYILFQESNGSHSIIRPDGTGRRRIIDFTYKTNDFFPYWSPDSKHVVWSSRRGADPKASRNIYIKNINGSDIIRLTRDTGAHEEYPLWQPTGEWIAFYKTDRLVEWRSDWRTPITLVNVAGTEYKVLWRGNSSDNGVCRWLSDWSPDGRYILFNAGSERGPGVFYDFWCFDVERLTFKQVTSAPSSFYWDYDGCFGPDGKIYFSVFDQKDVGYGIWRVDPKL